MPTQKTLTLEYDDFHWKSPENCLDFIEKQVKKYPDIKFSLFTSFMYQGFDIKDNLDWVSRVTKLIDSNNIRICVHGLYHTQEEFKYVTYDEAMSKLLYIVAQSPFFYDKVFRGPHWGLNVAAVSALNDMGYTHLYNHEDYKFLEGHFNGKTVYYNWNLKDEPPKDIIKVVAHGHTHPVCSNGMEETWHKVEAFIKEHNPYFTFASEV